MQELAGNKHDQAIVDTPFSISPHNFRYYKFSLREASTNVAIIGDFTASPALDKRKNTQPRESENGIEVYVLSETSFAIWQTGYVHFDAILRFPRLSVLALVERRRGGEVADDGNIRG